MIHVLAAPVKSLRNAAEETEAGEAVEFYKKL